MSLRLTAPSEDILGANYKITKIVASDYNPNIDSTITVTVTVKDVYDDPVENESVQVTCNIGKFTKLNGSTISDTQSVTGNTDSNGQFTLTYTCSEWGLATFSANNKTLQIHVTGWRTVWQNTTSSPTVRVEKEGNKARLILNGINRNITTSWVMYSETAHFLDYAPKQSVVALDNNGSVQIKLTTDGKLGWRSNTGSNISNLTFYTQIDWSIN